MLSVAKSGKLGPLRLLAGIGSALATGWLVWSNAVLPRLGWKPAGAIAAEAVSYVVAAWLCAAGITLAVYYVVSLAGFPDALRTSLRRAAPAMWFAPATILALTPVPAAFFLSLALVSLATTQLVSQWAPERPSVGTAPPFTTTLAAAVAQGGMAAEAWHHPLLGAAALAGAAAMVTTAALITGAYEPEHRSTLPPSMLSLLAAFVLAVSLCYGGLRVRAAHSGTGTESAPAYARDGEAPPGDTSVAGDFPGVILLPAQHPQAVLLIPPPPRVGLLDAPLAKPVGISFLGEYWILRWPAQRPPPHSFVRHGTPAEISFHTTDGWPMKMEAHQKLAAPADAGCCGSVELVLTCAESMPSAISLELLLADSQSAAVESLGDRALNARRFTQSLFYTVPHPGTLRRFDEIRVIYHRQDANLDRSARIAIDRFVLLP